MFTVAYEVAPSTIPGAGSGIFIQDAVAAGRILIAPDRIEETFRWDQILAMGAHRRAHETAVRWFEEHYTICPDWPDECYINHAFEPTGLWHLGFVFAAHDLPAGSELTIDYAFLLPDQQSEVFVDGISGREVRGLSWEENLRRSTQALAALL